MPIRPLTRVFWDLPVCVAAPMVAWGAGDFGRGDSLSPVCKRNQSSKTPSRRPARRRPSRPTKLILNRS